MPILSVYFGSKIVSAVVFSDRGGIISSHFDYTYSPYLYGHFYSEAAFNTDLISYFLKELKLKKENTKIIVTGLFEVPKLNYTPVFSATATDLLSTIQGTFPVMANHQSMLTRDEIIYSQKMNSLNSPMTDITSNMDIYNFSDLSFQIAHSIVQAQTVDLNQAVSSESITMFGELLYNTSQQEKSLMYKLLLDMVIPAGVYKLYYDENLYYIHKLAMQAAGLNFDADFNASATSELCTLINVPGETTCLVESEVGTTQLITINQDDLFILPIAPESKTKILLKNQSIGTRELKASGGKLGLIIDTRNKASSTFDPDVLNSTLTRKLDEALVSIVA